MHADGQTLSVIFGDYFSDAPVRRTEAPEAAGDPDYESSDAQSR
jgi:hypothetical protein